eukprot:6578592-Alexandrium_andersonii.AAC.1
MLDTSTARASSAAMSAVAARLPGCGPSLRSGVCCPRSPAVQRWLPSRAKAPARFCGSGSLALAFRGPTHPRTL